MDENNSTDFLQFQKDFCSPQNTKPSSSRCSSVNSSEISSCSKDTVSPVIPSHWCEQTQSCIDKKKLNPKARCDIVRTLATLLVSKHGSHPTKHQVEYIARQLILAFPFMRDDIGTGYVSKSLNIYTHLKKYFHHQASWYDKLLERMRNIRKRSKSTDGSTPKRKIPKSDLKNSSHLSLLRRYPPRQHTISDDETIEKHKVAMRIEMLKRKPREIVILPLMKQTYSARRDYVISPDRVSVEEILEEYPALRLPSSVSI